MSGKLVIYHAGCWDGFCSAWLLWQRFPDAEFMPAQYGDHRPDKSKIEGRDVYIVDFSYPRPILQQLYEWSASLIVLDHHKTAAKELDKLPYCVFDMAKSGASLTHEYIDRANDGVTRGLGTPPHWMVAYVEDRDLWNWELSHSRAVNAFLRSHPLDFETWRRIAKIEWDTDEFDAIVREGEAILRAEQQTVEAKVSQSHLVAVARPQNWSDDDSLFWSNWKVTNATTLVSETGEALAKETGVGCCWFELPSGERVYSLRAVAESNVDVSEIAKAFGGGGHKNAAGFRAWIHPWSV